MQVLTTTPFGQRPVTAALLKSVEESRAQAQIPHINKWELFRELCVAKGAYGITDRDLTVLNALLSFYQDTNLSDNNNMIVFPSNKALAERAHGMAESTLRRHIAALTASGLILRHDSPNGKRYASRDASGAVVRAFGFDLRPLLVKAHEITGNAAEVRAAQEHIRRLREEVTLTKRDAIKLLAYGEAEHPSDGWQALQEQLLEAHKVSRRSLDAEGLGELLKTLQNILADIGKRIAYETNNVRGSDNNNERHLHNSNKDSYDSELCYENSQGGAVEEKEPTEVQTDRAEHEEPNIPLAIVLKACPDIVPYADTYPRNWNDLVNAAEFVRGMMGISPDAWEQAKHHMGPYHAATTLAGILQRISDIRSPGGYLRALTDKAALDGFSPGPMVMALLNSGGEDDS